MKESVKVMDENAYVPHKEWLL